MFWLAVYRLPFKKTILPFNLQDFLGLVPLKNDPQSRPNHLCGIRSSVDATYPIGESYEH